MGQLHGVETIELTAGTVAVTTIETAIIGVVGTAPQAAGAVAATLTAGTPLLDNELTFTAKAGGRSGNTITVIAEQAVKEKSAGAVPTSAKWENGSLLITLGCSEKGAGNATVSDVVTAVNGVAGAGVSATGSGDGIVSSFSGTLSGGEDEPFPLNTPVAMAGTTALSRLGITGTLKQALTEINDQRNALSVIVRVEEKTKPEEQRAAILAGISMLSSAKSVTTYQPRIVIAPGFSEDDAVGKALETVAGKLRAVAYVDCAAGATLQEVVQRRQSYGARTELLRPRVQVSNAEGQLVYRPYSAFAAGLRARIDYEKGWWWS
ncbi:phage tail sheath subtilisin-like domain-containing protein, partial [Escherichia coli]|uniref:phage tail sheath subtilisin-like domain-containing protein n=1 Tax=Escherichia coli TaxID=562 RepID=UPI000BEAD09A